MATIAESLNLALQHHQAGRLAEAEQIYRQILQADQRQPDAWHLLGLLAHQLGQQNVAIEYIGNALAIDGRNAAYLCNMGTAMSASGNTTEARKFFEQSLALNPDFPQARYNLANLCREQGEFEAAIEHYRHASRLMPDDADTRMNLGIAFQQAERFDEAVTSYREALRLRPDYAETLNNLATVFVAQGKVDEATEGYEQALKLKPDYAEAHNNLGNLCHDMRKTDEALAHYQEAVRLKPAYAEAHNGLGNVLMGQERIAEAEASYRESVRVMPSYAEAHNNLGVLCLHHARRDEAQAEFEQAVTLKPEYVEGRFNRALIWLLKGDFKRGWPEYEWRWKRPTTRKRSYRQPLWDGSPLAGRKIFVYSEQGLGDAIQFVRYAPLIRNRGGVVVLECKPSLKSLLARSPGIDAVVTPDDPAPEFDVQVPLLSLPMIFGTTLETIPAQTPYVFPSSDKVNVWHEQLGETPGLKVGIVWQGSSTHVRDAARSVPLKMFAPLARVPGVTLYSLQKEAGRDQLSGWRAKQPIIDLADELNDFEDTAAVIRNLDVVIGCDTSVIHLAGALAKPAWVALHAAPDFRWLIDRTDSPWYPGMWLFRQSQVGDWSDVFVRIEQTLRQWATTRRMPKSPSAG